MKDSSIKALEVWWILFENKFELIFYYSLLYPQNIQFWHHTFRVDACFYLSMPNKNLWLDVPTCLWSIWHLSLRAQLLESHNSFFLLCLQPRHASWWTSGFLQRLRHCWICGIQLGEPEQTAMWGTVQHNEELSPPNANMPSLRDAPCLLLRSQRLTDTWKENSNFFIFDLSLQRTPKIKLPWWLCTLASLYKSWAGSDVGHYPIYCSQSGDYKLLMLVHLSGQPNMPRSISTITTKWIRNRGLITHHF